MPFRSFTTAGSLQTLRDCPSLILTGLCLSLGWEKSFMRCRSMTSLLEASWKRGKSERTCLDLSMCKRLVSLTTWPPASSCSDEASRHWATSKSQKWSSIPSWAHITKEPWPVGVTWRRFPTVHSKISLSSASFGRCSSRTSSKRRRRKRRTMERRRERNDDLSHNH